MPDIGSPALTSSSSVSTVTIADASVSTTKTNVTTVGSKNAIDAIILDQNGNQITSFGGSNASVSATGSAVPASATYIAGIKSGNLTGLTLDGSSNLNVNISANSFGTFTVTATNLQTNLNQIAGSAISTAASGIQKVGVTGNAGAALDAAGQNASSPANELLVAAQFNTTPLTISSGNISPLQFGNSKGFLGMVIMDAAGNIRGANVDASNNLMVNLNANSFGTITVTATNLQTNINQIAGSAVSTASSGTILVGNADGSGNKLTTNSTTFTSKFALDGNLLGTLGTAFSTAGKVDVKGADGDVFVRQATAANLNATVVGQATGSAVPSTAFYAAANAQTALPTAASAGNLTGLTTDKFGRLVVIPQGFRDLVLPIPQLTLTSTTTETTLIAQVASTFLDLLSISIINTSATGTQVDLRDSTGGTIRYSFYCPPTDMRGISFTVPLVQNAVNNNWTAKCGTSVSSIIITGHYISNK